MAWARAPRRGSLRGEDVTFRVGRCQELWLGAVSLHPPRASSSFPAALSHYHQLGAHPGGGGSQEGHVAKNLKKGKAPGTPMPFAPSTGPLRPPAYVPGYLNSIYVKHYFLQIKDYVAYYKYILMYASLSISICRHVRNGILFLHSHTIFYEISRFYDVGSFIAFCIWLFTWSYTWPYMFTILQAAMGSIVSTFFFFAHGWHIFGTFCPTTFFITARPSVCHSITIRTVVAFHHVIFFRRR